MKHLRQYIRQFLLESRELQADLDELIHNREDHAYTVGLGTAHREYAKHQYNRVKPDVIDKSLLKAPRNLNDPVNWRFSSFRKTFAPVNSLKNGE